MSLDGAKLLLIGEDGVEHNNVVLAKGRTFKFGYYMDCDVVLEHPDALGLQCTIDCDAFGRVTIANLSQDQVITINGKPLKKLRPLLHNTEICIFDKKFLWFFERDENLINYMTPKKQAKKAEQPPNSEPGLRWRTLDRRLTIHTFSYSIKSGKDSQTAYINTDCNNSSIACETIKTNSLEPLPTNKQSLTPCKMNDLIDLETPKPKQMSFAGQKTPLLCCSFSETVITSYSPRDKTVRTQVNSYAVVQSPSGTPRKGGTRADVTLGPFKQISSPLVVNQRPSMHLIDLTTPMKRPALVSPLKTGHKKNKVEQLRLSCGAGDASAESTASTVFSVHSTDDESVIELSDDGSFSPSPVIKTPPRTRTPQSLMKRAILSSAKKAIAKPVQPPAAPPPVTPSTPKSPTATKVNFQSRSTPQRKSLAAMECMSADRTKVSKSVLGKSSQSMVTSTPFRSKHSGISNKRSSILSSPSTPLLQSNKRSSTLRSPSSSLVQGSNKSRTSLMLRQALTASPSQKKSEKSVLVTESSGTPYRGNKKSRKSVSFLEQSNDVVSELNRTFSVEEIQDCTNEIEVVSESVASLRKDATFSPEKKSNENETDDCIVVPLDETEDEKVTEKDDFQNQVQTNEEPSLGSISDSSIVAETPLKKRSSSKPSHGVPTTTKRKSTTENVSSTILDSPRKNKDSIIGIDILPDSHSKNSLLSVPQTPQSSKGRLRKTPLYIKPSSAKNLRNIIDEEDFEGLDAVFKTPKARNVMILSSPKSVALKKPSVESVELMHSTQFNMSTNLDELFKTPQSELVVNRTETTINVHDEDDAVGKSVLSPEEAFDKLVGRPTVEKCYVRKGTTKQRECLPLYTPRDPDLPKTDIEEWIDKVNESIERTDEDEISYLTTDKNEFTLDPLMMSTISEEVATTNKKQTANTTLSDEIAMTIQKGQQGNDITNESVLKDPLEASIVRQSKKSFSPNVSGIDLLDHTSESAFSETLAISDDSSEKENFEHVVLTTAPETRDHVNISPTKTRNEIEEAFENFEKERNILEANRLVSTPEPLKPKVNIQNAIRRKTVGSSKIVNTSIDKQELAFESFVKESVHTTKICTVAPDDKQPCLKNLEDEPFPTIPGNSKITDIKRIKSDMEIKLAFTNFQEKPVLTAVRTAKTPDTKKSSLKDHRRTMGTKFIPERELDLEAAKSEREMELAFENFQEKPVPTAVRTAKTPDTKKYSLKDHRRTMGTKLIPEKELDLKAAKSDREMELAFENFQEKPVPNAVKTAKTPDTKKSSLKDHRRTMGTKFIPEKELDLEAAKLEREMELVFQNFQEKPVPTALRTAKTPDTKKSSLKDHRRTMGTKFIPEKEFDLEVAKSEREMELAFENFQEKPVPTAVRTAKTPDTKKSSLKDHRRTMGTKFIPERELDLEAAKSEREMELAFENFQEKPVPTAVRTAKTPDTKKSSLKDHRRTMGTKLIPEKELDLEVAKSEREMELAFENFQEKPVPTAVRTAKTPDTKKSSLKDHRRTMGTKFIPEKELDLEVAKSEREMELAFENFQEKPVPTAVRTAKTPDTKKCSLKDHRRTMGTKFIPEKELDLEAAKSEREMELAFENFQEKPVPTAVRTAKTPDTKKSSLKDHRRTMGTKFIPERELDLEAAKSKREMELAFENFQEKPVPTAVRTAKTPDTKKSSLKDHRRTMGTKFIPEKELDLEVAKSEREMELAFENFQEKPVPTAVRTAKTPDTNKNSLKDHRRTMGTKFIPEKELDIEAAKSEREMELAFENFQEKPVPTAVRTAKTPDTKKSSLKDHRRTMGTKFIPEKELDLEVAKSEREMELAFENFQEKPVPTAVRTAKTPDTKKSSLKDHRRTMGTKLIPEKELDLEAAKSEREMELAFENFQEKPVPTAVRTAKTPDPKKSFMKDHRRTMGTKFIPEKELDLEVAKSEREMELAFENFQEKPVPTAVRTAKTPDTKKSSLKDHRRTMGTKLIPEKELDLKAAKSEREMELAFENFQEKPVPTAVRTAKTPDTKKSSLKDHRRTMGTKLIPEKELDIEAAKSEREMELAFENFQENPVPTAVRTAKSPDTKKSSLKDHRRTMGIKFIPEKVLDLEAAKSEREMELAFENFQEKPVPTAVKTAKTPDTKKSSLKDHRRTVGTKFIPEKELDLEAAKSDREMELASMRDNRRTTRTKFVPERELDFELNEVSLKYQSKLISGATSTKNELVLRSENKSVNIGSLSPGDIKTKIGGSYTSKDIMQQGEACEIVFSLININDEAQTSEVNSEIPVPKEETDEIVPSTPLHTKRRGRTVKKLENDNNMNKESLNNMQTQEMSLVRTNEKSGPNDGPDEIVPSTPFHPKRRGRKPMNALKIEDRSITGEAAHKGEKKQVLGSSEASGSRTPHEVAHDMNLKNPENEIMGELEINVQSLADKGGLSETKLNLEEVLKETNSLSKVETTTTDELNSLEPVESCIIEPKMKEIKVEADEIKEEIFKTDAQFTASTRTRSRRLASKDELRNTENTNILKSIATNRSISEEEVKKETPIRRRGRGRPTKKETITETTQENAIDKEEVKTEEVTEHFESDSTVLSTPVLRRGPKGAIERDVSLSEKASEFISVSKNVRRRKVEQGISSQAEEIDTKNEILNKRSRISNSESDLKESQGNNLNTEELITSNLKAQTAYVSKKRNRTETVKSELSEAKIQSPLRKRGRRQDNDMRDETGPSSTVKENQTKAGSDQLVQEDKQKVAVSEIRVRGRKQVSQKPLDKIVSDNESVKVESDATPEIKPTRAWKVLVKNNSLLESDLTYTVEELDEKRPVDDLGTKDTKFEDAFEKESGCFQLDTVNDSTLQKEMEEVCDKLPTTELENTKFEEKSQQKLTRSRRAVTTKKSAHKVSQTSEEVFFAADTESQSTKSEDTSRKKPTRSRRVAVKENFSKEETHVIEELSAAPIKSGIDSQITKIEIDQVHPIDDTESENTKSEETSQQKPARSRRAAVRPKSSQKISQTIEEHSTSEAESQNTKPEDTTQKKPNRSRRAAVQQQGGPQNGEHVNEHHSATDIQSQSKSEIISEIKQTRSRRGASKDLVKLDSQSVEENSDDHVSFKLTQETSDNVTEEDSEHSQKALAKSEEIISANASTAKNAEIPKKPSSETSSDNMINPVDEVVKTQKEIFQKKTTRGRKALTRNNTSTDVAHLTTDAEKSESDENLVKRSVRARRNPAKPSTSAEVKTSQTDEEHHKSIPHTKTEARGQNTDLPNTADETAVSVSLQNTFAGVEEPRESEMEIKPTRNRRIAELQEVEKKRTPKTRSRKPAPSTDTEDEAVEQQTPKPTRAKRAVQPKTKTPSASSSKAIEEETKLPKTRVTELQESEEKHTPKTRGRKPAAKTEIEDVVEKQTPKSTRGKKVEQPKIGTSVANNSKLIAEEKELPKRTTRTRKAAAKHEPSESEDDHHQKDLKNKSSRSRKASEPTVEEDVNVLKRGNRQIREVLTDESSNTPKRSRRKLKT